ncbi:MAG: C25 family cysteine peptidase [Bacteroidota bacterium]|nr:C25 family cysteine peptidase [Bacteroidota bacterium]
MIKHNAILGLSFICLLVGADLSRAQVSTQVVRNDAYRYDVRDVRGVRVFHIDGITPVHARELRLPRRVLRIPIEAGESFDIAVQASRLSPPVDATPFYTVDYWLGPDSLMRSQVLPYTGVVDDPAIAKGVDVLARRIVHERRRPMLEIELPLVVWNAQTRQTQWVEEITLARVPSDAFARLAAAEEKPPYASMPFTTRSRNVDTAQAWIDFTAPMLRFFVRQDGLYTITADWLREAGVDPATVEPSRLQLYRKGVAIPMAAVGLDDGRFDDGDAFIFHGTRNYDERGYRRIPASTEDPYPEYLSIYTDSTAYWLNFNVAGATRAAPRVPISPLPADTLDWTYERIHIESDPWNQLMPHTTDLVHAQIPDWTAEDTWAMGQFWFEPNDAAKVKQYAQRFRVSHIHPDHPVRFWTKLISWYGDWTMVPNHAHTLSLNDGPALDSVVFEHDQQVILFGTEVADSLRLDVDNFVRSTSWNINTAGSAVRLDWFDVEYPRFLAVDETSHIFRIDSTIADGEKSVKLTGVRTADPMVLRVRDTDVAVLPAAKAEGSGPYTVFLSDEIRPGDMLYVWNRNDIPVPAKGELQSVQRLDDEEAEHVLITAGFLAPAAEEYAAFIEDSYEVRSRVVRIEDIYNLYSYGMFQPEAIKLFTFDAYHGWRTDSLQYLFLVGDANYNYRAGFTSNIVPSYGNPVSDTWYVAFDSLSVQPSIGVGRLPIREERWVRQYLDRHRAYRSQEQTLWNKSTLHFSGGNIDAGEPELAKYRMANELAINTVVRTPPFAGHTEHFYKTIDPRTDYGPLPVAEVRARIRKGGVFICYLGHSGTQTWDNSISDIDQLRNDEDRASLITDFGCSTGRYAEPDYLAFSELFIGGEGSHAIAYIGNSATGFVSTALVMPTLFYRPLVIDGVPSLGEAHLQMKSNLGTWNVVNRISIQTNTLVGDPIVALDLPRYPNPLVKTEWIRADEEIITDVMDSLSLTVAIGNYGLQTPDSVEITIENFKNGVMTAAQRFTRPMPALYDTIRTRFALDRIAGSGSVRVTVDPNGRIEETSDADNVAALEYRIFSTFLKVPNDHIGVVSSRGNEIAVLNPTFDPGPVSTVTIESDASRQFTAPTAVTIPYAQTVSGGTAPTLFPAGEKRYWRVKLDAAGQDFVGPFIRRGLPHTAEFIQADSTEFADAATVDFVRYDSGFTFPPGKRIELLGSSYALGSTVHIKIDGINLLPMAFASGYCIVIADSATLNVKRSAVFDNYSVVEHRDSIRRWAEEVTFGEYFICVTGNEPRNASSAFFEQIKELGSKYIDSVRFKAWRPSWAFIGRRGAPIGTMPEAYFSEASRIPAVIDTTFYVAPDTGSVTSEAIGPAARWETAWLERSDPARSDIRLSVIGVRSDGSEEVVLDAGNVTDADLSSIDAAVFPRIKLRARFFPQGGDPRDARLHAWSVAYTHLPELAINYQSVAITRDSVAQGEPVEIRVGVFNAGEGDAPAFPVHLEVVGADNIPRPAGVLNATGLRTGQWYDTTAVINTDFLGGPYQLFVRVDRDDVVHEQFEDNNTFLTAFHVTPDTSRPRLDVTFDGFTPLDDDYIRYNPEIVMTLYSENPSPVTSRDHFTVTVDGEDMDLDSIGFVFTPATKEQPATLRFQPTLADGIYYFGFNAEDAKNTPVYDEVPEIRVRVSTDNRIAEVYNFPNPFQNETAFTFLLTGAEPPREVEVKVYTVAGRLIRTLSYPASSMRIGYNALKWDGRDQDGDTLANGVYFYKIITHFTDETSETIGRMAVLR